jgi:hypothetical protein
MRPLDFFSALQSSTEGIATEFNSDAVACWAGFGSPISPWPTHGGTIVVGVAEKSTDLVWEGVSEVAQLRTPSASVTVSAGW